MKSKAEFYLACFFGLAVVAAFPLHHLYMKFKNHKPQSAGVQAQAQIAGAAEAAWKTADYAALEKAYEDAAPPAALTSEGLPKLQLFYKSLDASIAAGNPADESYWALVHEKIMVWHTSYPASPAPFLVQAAADADQGSPAKLGEAAVLLDKTRETTSADPQWYAVLFRAALGLNWAPEQVAPFIDEAAARFPAYYPAFYAALVYHYPQWHGNAEVLDAVVNRIAGHAPEPDRDVSYARLYTQLSADLWHNDLFRASRADWPRLQKGLREIETRYPDIYNQNVTARFSCLAGDKPATAAALQKIGSSVITEAWDATPAMAARCSDWALGTVELREAGAKYGTLSKLPEPEQVEAVRQIAGGAFMDGDYGAADALAADFARTQAKFPGGGYKIAAVYDGIEDMMKQLKIGTDEAAWAEMLEKAEAWRKAYPGSTVPLLVHAMATLQFADSFRAAPPAPETQAKFDAAADMARKDLESVRVLAGKDPEWYVLMLQVAADQNWPLADTTALATQALDAAPAYVPLYHAALLRLLPLWARAGQGQPYIAQQIEAFAQSAAARTQKESGDGLYADTYVHAAQNYLGSHIFQASYANWPRMQKGFGDLLKLSPANMTVFNDYAFYACLAQDQKTAKALLPRIRKPDEKIWVPAAFYGTCAKWAGVTK